MPVWNGIGGDFLADGTVREFASQRAKPNDNPGHFGLTYSEVFNPAGGGILVGNANSYWKFGLERLESGSIYWCWDNKSSGFITSSINALRSGTYVVVCQAFQRYPTGQNTVARIRFGGDLNLP